MNDGHGKRGPVLETTASAPGRGLLMALDISFGALQCPRCIVVVVQAFGQMKA